MSFECLDCKAIQQNGHGYCADCSVHVDDLQELIEEWRDDADPILEDDHEHGEYHEGYNDGRRFCSQQLEKEL